MIIENSIPLASFTTFGIGGPADIFISVTTIEELVEAIQYAVKQHKPYFILGTGANILIGDKGYRGVVIKNNANKITIQDTKVMAESGATIHDLITQTAEKGLSGLEHFAGIPSSVGGALWQNLHFLSPDRKRTIFIGEVLESADLFTQDQERKTVDRTYFLFNYDYSILHDIKDIVLSATFLLQKHSQADIDMTIKKNIAWRHAKHPADAVKTSAGSIFKKLEGYGAGRLIEQVGLKGQRIGGAMISDKHANFIINTGNAKAADVRALIDLVRKRVNDELHLHLETEISFIGEF